jgi:hypothetical protein
MRDLDLDAAEGIFTVGFVPSLVYLGYEVPPGGEKPVFKIRGFVPENAPSGQEVLLTPTNGSADGGVGRLHLRNEVTYRGQARFVTAIPRTEPGRLKIAADITIFLRGDADSSREVDISDAIFILRFLFLGDRPPRCLDAADANDDGALDQSDAITILSALFLGAERVRPPYPSFGRDPTEDELGICRGQ